MNDMISRAAAIEAVTNADRNCLGAHGAREAKWTGMGCDIAPKLDPNCECVCHRQPGVMHVAPCCQSQSEAEPVGWFGFDQNTGEFTAEWCSVKPADDTGFRPLYAHPTPAPVEEGLDAERLVTAWLDETEAFATRRERLMDDVLAECDLAPWLHAACQVGIDAALRCECAHGR